MRQGREHLFSSALRQVSQKCYTFHLLFARPAARNFQHPLEWACEQQCLFCSTPPGRLKFGIADINLFNFIRASLPGTTQYPSLLRQAAEKSIFWNVCSWPEQQFFYFPTTPRRPALHLMIYNFPVDRTTPSKDKPFPISTAPFRHV